MRAHLAGGQLRIVEKLAQLWLRELPVAAPGATTHQLQLFFSQC